MKLNRNITIAFFIFLTLSIGVVSTNSVAKSVYAQSNALIQDGNSQADQDIDQAQTSNQDNQVVSGDSSILSGNNIQCHNQINSKTTSGMSDAICAFGDLDIPDSNEMVKIKFIIKSDVNPECVPGTARNHGCDHEVGSYSVTSGINPPTRIIGQLTIGQLQTGKTIEVSVPYSNIIFFGTTVNQNTLNIHGYKIISTQVDNMPQGYGCGVVHGTYEGVVCNAFNPPMDGQELVISVKYTIVNVF